MRNMIPGLLKMSYIQTGMTRLESIAHQMKDSISLYLMMYLILRIYINVKNYIQFLFLHISLQSSIFHSMFILNNLKFCEAVYGISIE